MKKESSGLSRAGVRDRGGGTDQALLQVPDSQGGGTASQAQDSKLPGPGRAPATLLSVGGKLPAQPGRRPAGEATASRVAAERLGRQAGWPSGKRLSCAKSG